jgi:hypothetical protein
VKLVVRNAGLVRKAWCPVCRQEVETISPAEAVTISGMGEVAGTNREHRGLHVTQTSFGPRVCFKAIVERS